ncbi:MAG: response regulator transcription factor [Solirubrobacteraceae bacterium]|nr:response regulator transcription factor [Solirubrobacteraceae bacterium]
MEPLRVLVAEDQALLRAGLVGILEKCGIDVVAQAADATDLLRKARAHKPDVVVTDVQMPPDHTDDGLRAAVQIRRELPETGVLVLSQFLEESYALDLVGEDAAGVGYLLKDRVGDVATFIESVRRVAAGGSALDPRVVASMLGRRRKDDPLQTLSPRERDVLSLMAEGLSNQGIGEALHVTPAAVEKHVTGIFSKLDLGHEPTAHRRVLAVLRVLRAA